MSPKLAQLMIYWRKVRLGRLRKRSTNNLIIIIIHVVHFLDFRYRITVHHTDGTLFTSCLLTLMTYVRRYNMAKERKNKK